MGVDTTTATDHPSTNALDDIEADLLSIPPAYLSFGSTPAALEDPPNIDDTEIYIVRVRCVGESRSERTDGEMRHGRKLQIQWCVKKGQPEPPNPEDAQPALFDSDGQPADPPYPDGTQDIPVDGEQWEYPDGEGQR